MKFIQSNRKISPIKIQRNIIEISFNLDILQTAIKELQIEKNLKDIQQQWDTMRFQIHKHFRHTFVTNIQQERGFIISGVDDILQALEDSTLLVNSILTFHQISSNYFSFLRYNNITFCWYLSSASRTMDSNIIIDFRSD